MIIPSHRSAFAISGWFMSIPTGVACLMQRFGKDCGEAQPGLSTKPPFYRIAYIVNKQYCNYSAPVKECATADNVRVGIEASVRFSVRDAAKFVYKLGAVHFDQLLSGAVDEGIRILVRKYIHKDVRSLRGSGAQSLESSLNQKFGECGVQFDNIQITAVMLPPSLEASLEHTTQMEKAMIATAKQHANEMEQIEQRSRLELQELKRQCENVIVTENGKKKRAELNHEQRVVKASEERQVALIETQQKAEVSKMEATALLERTQVDMERLRVETISKAERDAEETRVKADIAFDQLRLNAEAEKMTLLGEADAIRMDAEAEAKSSQHLIHKRKHELEMREKEVIMKLAQKGNFHLIGEPGDKMIDALMTGHLSGVPTKPSSSGWFK